MRCVVAEQTYGLRMSWVRGVQRTEQLRRHDRPQGGTIGWLPQRPDDIPVCSLGARLGYTHDVNLSTAKIILLNTPSQPWAVLVERIEGIIEVASDAVFPLPAIVRNPAAPLFDGVVYHAGAAMLTLMPDGLHPDLARRTAASQALMHIPEVLPALASMPPAPSTTGKLLCFTTTASAQQEPPMTFGLSLSQVVRMQQTPALLAVPGAAPHVLGLMQWQGAPLAVIDLGSRLGGPATVVMPDSRLLIARATTRRAFVSFPVRPQVQVRTLPLAHQPCTRPLPLHASLMRGRFDCANEILVIPDIDGLCAPQEEQRC
jgi:chemotaxis signal transduction protein